MAKYEAIGRAMVAREYAERKFRREEAALQRAHLAEMARLDREHKSTEGAADRTLRKEEGALDRQHRKDMKYADIDAQAERDKFAATERANAAKLKATAESITPDSVLSALNNTSYKSSNGEQADASGGYKVFSLPAWIDGQVTAAVTAAEDAAERKTIETDKEYKDELTTEERKIEIIAEARERAGEKARVAATRAATEQANNVLAEMTLKARQYVLAGETPESALKKVKKELGSQSNSLFANHFRPRQKPTTSKTGQKTPTEKTAETQQQGWFKSRIDNARTKAMAEAKRKTN